MPHLTLLGDATVGGDLAEITTEHLGEDWQVDAVGQPSLRAELAAQAVAKIADETTHVLVSVGGSDALAQSSLWARDVGNLGSALFALDHVQQRFQRDYRRLLTAVTYRELRVVVTTLYLPELNTEARTQAARAMLAPFNDVIVHEAASRGLDVLDTRALTSDAGELEGVAMTDAGRQRLAAGIATAMNEAATERTTLFSV